MPPSAPSVVVGAVVPEVAVACLSPASEASDEPPQPDAASVAASRREAGNALDRMDEA